jgi:DNA-binding response OmpR family regulator
MGAIVEASISQPTLASRKPTPGVFVGDPSEQIWAAGLREARRLSRFTPIIILIPLHTMHDADDLAPMAGTKSFADDSGISKLHELFEFATIHSEAKTAESHFTFGDVEISFSSMETSRKGKLVALTPMEFKTLRYFTLNAGRVISRDELLDKVWGYENYPCTRTVDNHILQLRRKLEEDPSRPIHFQTVHGAGYKFLP